MTNKEAALIEKMIEVYEAKEKAKAEGCLVVMDCGEVAQ